MIVKGMLCVSKTRHVLKFQVSSTALFSSCKEQRTMSSAMEIIEEPTVPIVSDIQSSSGLSISVYTSP